MNKNQLSIYSFILFVFLMSCTNNKDAKIDEKKFSDHSSIKSLDWKGTYKGTLPCADCPGIETILTLDGNNTYQLKRTYLGKGEPKDEKGNFTWNSDGNRIMLDSDNGWYQVAENQLIHLDRTGNKITGALASSYTLAKQ